MPSDAVDHLTLALDDRPPDAHLRAVVAALGGDWEIEGAHATWRARQSAGDRTHEVGLGRMGPDQPWLIAWRVDPEIPDRHAFLGLGLAMGAAFIAAAGGVWLGAGVWTPVASGVGLFGTLQIARQVITSRLPDTAADRHDLGERLRAALDATPGVEITAGIARST